MQPGVKYVFTLYMDKKELHLYFEIKSLNDIVSKTSAISHNRERSHSGDNPEFKISRKNH